MDQEIFYWSAVEMLNALRQKKLSAVELMEIQLKRLEQLNPVLNGLIQKISSEECLKQANQADQHIVKGKIRKLTGLPVTVKDKHLVKGLISCVGSVGLKNKISQEDSTIVTRLKEEGAIIIGITNVPEFLSAYETDNSVYGRTNNPYDLSRTPGGSSGGCAALIASGCIPLSIGSDAAGSIRWPAHCTGITAHKPTIGLIPRTGSPLGNALGLFSQFATSGPMARSVMDLILTLPILAGPDGIDPYIPPVSIKNHQSVEIRQLRVGYIIEDMTSNLDEDIQKSFQQTIEHLKSYVESVEPIQIECLKDTHRLLWESFYLGGDQGQGVKNTLKMLAIESPSPLLQTFLKEAEKSLLSTTQFKSLFREIDTYKIKIAEALANFDILLSPVAATPAKKHGTTLKECKDITHCMMHSLTGWPVTVVRCGTSQEGLPIGLQIAAKPWNDSISLALGSFIESITGGWKPPFI